MRANNFDDEQFIWDTIELDDDISDEGLDEGDLLGEDLLNPDDIDDQDTKDNKEQEIKFKKSNFKQFRGRVKFLVGAIVILLIVSLFIPFIPVNTVVYNETNFTDVDSVKSQNKIADNSRVSFFDLIKCEFELKQKTKQNLNVDYNWKDHNLNVTINEEIPVARFDKTTYYRIKDKIYTSNDFPREAPNLIGINKDQVNSIVEQLAYLDYNIIKEINDITLQASNEEPNLVVMTMKDGNYVFINIEQISTKMPYYNQAVSVVASMNGEQSRGIFHFDYGDYYEPF